MLVYYDYFSSMLLCVSLSEKLAKFVPSTTTEHSWWHVVHLKADDDPVSSDVVFPSTSKLFQSLDEAIKASFDLADTLGKSSNKSNERAVKCVKSSGSVHCTNTKTI